MFYTVLSCIILVLFAIGFVLWIIENKFLRYDLYVDGELFKGCRYEHHKLFKELEIWNTDTGCYIRTKYKSFCVKRSYWTWQVRADEEDPDAED